jgi:hypothetical protein
MAKKKAGGVLPKLTEAEQDLVWHGNMVSLHIENEKGSLVLGHRCWVEEFLSLYSGEAAEHGVHV